MGKKKPRMSLFSTMVQQINEHDSQLSSNEYHLIDNEYFAAFNSVDDIQQFHDKLNDKQQEQSTSIDNETDLHTEPDDNDLDMKSFAEHYLIDLPEHITQVTDNLNLSRTSSQEIFTTDHPINWSPKVKGAESHTSPSTENKKRKSSTPVKFNLELNNKRPRRSIRDLPQSIQFSLPSDDDQPNPLNSAANIFACLQNEKASNRIVHENMNSILLTLTDQQSRNNDAAISMELAESSAIKNEPVESEQVMVETKEEPVDINITSFSTSEFCGDLDNYVNNIHLRHQPSNVEESNTSVSSRPKRIRKRKKLYIEESELPTRSRKLKTSIRKKRPTAPPPSLLPSISSALQLTDAEIEQQFGERLPTVKAEHDHDPQQIADSHVVIEFEPIIRSPQTPIESAREKLTAALGRGHEPDTYLLKIRSREHKIIEVELAIYGTADWHAQRTKILSKIEEALRGLRVSWTKIDILVDDFDVQISTSSLADSITPPSLNANASWFLKALSESGPLIVHIHDRRHPQQRFLIKCSCPECSSTSINHSIDSSLPVIVNVSPATTPTRRLTTPSILNKSQQTNISSLHNISTTFFNQLIYQWGRNSVISVTQCVLDLALIVSVHASLPSLSVSPNYSKEEYKKKYQQIIDPLKYTLNDNEKMLLNKTPMIARVVGVNSMNNTQSIVLSKPPDILTFYDSIKQHRANIRSAKSMRTLITSSFSTPSSSPSPPASQSNLLKTQTLILPKPTTALSLSTNQVAVNLLELRKVNDQSCRSRHRSFQTNRYDKYARTYQDINEPKQQPICTPIIELKPIMGGSTITSQNIHSFTRENTETIVVRDSQNDELRKVTTIISTNTRLNETQSTMGEMISPSNTSARVIRLSIAKSALPHIQSNSSNLTSPPTILLVASSKTNPSYCVPSVNNGETVPLIPKQINIIKPLSSSSSACITSAVKLSNPILISRKSQQPPAK